MRRGHLCFQEDSRQQAAKFRPSVQRLQHLPCIKQNGSRQNRRQFQGFSFLFDSEPVVQTVTPFRKPREVYGRYVSGLAGRERSFRDGSLRQMSGAFQNGVDLGEENFFRIDSVLLGRS